MVREIITHLDDVILARIVVGHRAGTTACIVFGLNLVKVALGGIENRRISSHFLNKNILRIEGSFVRESIEFLISDFNRLDFAVLIKSNDIRKRHGINIDRQHKVVDLNTCSGIDVREVVLVVDTTCQAHNR